MNNDEIMQALADVNAIITGTHVVYTSGRHGATYVNKDAIYLHPRLTEQLCGVMASDYAAEAIDVIAGPTTGGVILSQWVAWHLTRARATGETLAVFAEEEGAEKARVFRRGYDQQIAGRQVVVVEDIVTTGGSARKVIAAVQALGGIVKGLSLICNRGGITAADVGDIPIHALTTLPLDSWDEAECPLCQQGVPINTSVGKGQAFLARQHRD